MRCAYIQNHAKEKPSILLDAGLRGTAGLDQLQQEREFGEKTADLRLMTRLLNNWQPKPGQILEGCVVEPRLPSGIAR